MPVLVPPKVSAGCRESTICTSIIIVLVNRRVENGLLAQGNEEQDLSIALEERDNGDGERRRFLSTFS